MITNALTSHYDGKRFPIGNHRLKAKQVRSTLRRYIKRKQITLIIKDIPKTCHDIFSLYFQFLRRQSDHETSRQPEPYKTFNKPFSYNSNHQSHRKQYRPSSINYYQNYVNTVRQYFKQQKPKDIKPSVKRWPNRYEHALFYFLQRI